MVSKKHRLAAILLTLFLLIIAIAFGKLPGMMAYASNVTDADYVGIIRITNNSTAAQYVSVPFSFNTADAITLNNLADNCTNSAVRTQAGADAAYQPAISGNTSWPVFVLSVGALTSYDYPLYLGGSVSMDGKLRYFPADAGMTVTDNTTLELSANGTVEVAGFVNTDNGINKNLFVKPGAIRTRVSQLVSGNITFTAGENITGFTEVDTGGYLTRTATTVTAVACQSGTDAYVYYDYGVGYFDSVDALVELSTSGDAANPLGYGGIAFTNTVNDISGLAGTDLWVVGVPTDATHQVIILGRGATISTNSTANITAGVYWINLVKNVGNDNAYAYIYSDPNYSTLVDTLTISGVGATTTYRYAYSFINVNNGDAARRFSGYTTNMDLGGGGRVTLTGVASGEYVIRVSIGE